MNHCRIGVIGESWRGRSMTGIMAKMDDVEIVAVCDLLPDRVEKGQEIVKESCGKKPNGYTDYKKMLRDESLDCVYIATTWITHVPLAIDAMEAGVHAGIEVGGAASEDECRELIRTSKRTGKWCMIMENCCYDENEMAVMNMVRMGLFGEVTHCEGGYRHDLREEICMGRENVHGRLANFTHRNGELYPTHEIGPISKILDINRGNRYLYLVSMSSKSRGLNQWLETRKGADYDLTGTNFNCGDVTTTLLKCANGESVTIVHDCCSPRPYYRQFTVEGTKAIYHEYHEKSYGLIHFDGDEEKWSSFEERCLKKYTHELWRDDTTSNFEAGHGGMDYLILRAFIESVENGEEPPIDVYDTATWMAITYLSEQSVAMGSMPVPFPDFTNGLWINRPEGNTSKYRLDK